MPYIGFSPGMGTRDRFIYTATASQTTFTGADDNGKTLRYDSGDFVDVYLNGILLVPVTDYTATSLTSIVLTQAASADDTLEVLSLQAVSVADTVPKSRGGEFEGEVTATKFLSTTTKVSTAIFSTNEQTLSTDTTIASTENASCAGPLTIDSNTTLTLNGNLTVI